jgi:peroxiredoxin
MVKTDRMGSTRRRPVEGLKGKAAIPFSIADAGGRVHRLDEYRGKWLLMVFHRHLG